MPCTQDLWLPSAEIFTDTITRGLYSRYNTLYVYTKNACMWVVFPDRSDMICVRVFEDNTNYGEIRTESRAETKGRSCRTWRACARMSRRARERERERAHTCISLLKSHIHLVVFHHLSPRPFYLACHTATNSLVRSISIFACVQIGISVFAATGTRKWIENEHPSLWLWLDMLSSSSSLYLLVRLLYVCACFSIIIFFLHFSPRLSVVCVIVERHCVRWLCLFQHSRTRPTDLSHAMIFHKAIWAFQPRFFHELEHLRHECAVCRCSRVCWLTDNRRRRQRRQRQKCH